MNGDDATYIKLEAKLTQITNERDAIAQKMNALLEGAVFNNKPVDPIQATLLIVAADTLIASVAR